MNFTSLKERIADNFASIQKVVRHRVQADLDFF